MIFPFPNDPCWSALYLDYCKCLASIWQTIIALFQTSFNYFDTIMSDSVLYGVFMPVSPFHQCCWYLWFCTWHYRNHWEDFMPSPHNVSSGISGGITLNCAHTKVTPAQTAKTWTVIMLLQLHNSTMTRIYSLHATSYKPFATLCYRLNVMLARKE